MTTAAKENTLNNHQKFLAFALTLLTFILGTSEFVIVGLLTEVSSDLKISVATAGTLVLSLPLPTRSGRRYLLPSQAGFQNTR